MGALAASTLGGAAYEEAGTGSMGARPRIARGGCLVTGRLPLDDLREGRLAVLDHVQAVIGERRFAVLVERVLAKNTLAILRLLDELLGDSRAFVRLVPRRLQRVES